MNSEGEAMTNKSKRILTPKLRFEEFQGQPKWKETPLDQLSDRITTKNLDRRIMRVLTNSAEHGIVDQRDYFEKDIANPSNIDSYYIVDLGDYVYNPRISTFAPVGPISRNNIGKGVMSPLYTVFRFDSENTDFYQHYFRSASWHSYLRRVSSMGARHDRMSVTTHDFMTMPVPTPPDREQKKIADCLGSLDGLITAEGTKLEALRDHKRGLMQHLFPQTGETQPRLRFPEFRDKGEWEEKSLEEVCDLKAGDFVQSSKISPERGDRMHPCYGGNGLRGFVTTFTHSGRYILIGRQGALCGNVNLFDEQFHATEHALVAKPNLDIYVDWLFYALTDLNLNRFATGQAQPGLSVAVLNAVDVCVPSSTAEQHLIADFLCTLDTLIAKQAAKVDALKKHKSGLMQRLFPAPEAI